MDESKQELDNLSTRLASVRDRTEKLGTPDTGFRAFIPRGIFPTVSLVVWLALAVFAYATDGLAAGMGFTFAFCLQVLLNAQANLLIWERKFRGLAIEGTSIIQRIVQVLRTDGMILRERNLKLKVELENLKKTGV